MKLISNWGCRNSRNNMD